MTAGCSVGGSSVVLVVARPVQPPGDPCDTLLAPHPSPSVTGAQAKPHQHFLTLSMAQIKLTYFNLRARAEPARLILAHAGVKYEDRRIPAPWDNPAPWTAMKPTTPYGQCPLLEWDGEVIAQSMTITRCRTLSANLPPGSSRHSLV